MSDTCGPTSALPSMRYNLASSSWRTCAATSLWDLEMSSPTFPEWGMTLGGELYELPTPERPTVAPASSSPPTPLARDANEQLLYRTDQFGPNASDTLSRALANHLLPTPVADHSRGLAQPGTDFQSLPNAVMDLLPTPTTPTAKHGETPDTTAHGFGSNLWDIPHLLPTPTVMDMGGGRTPQEWEDWKQAMRSRHANGNGHGASLEQEALSLGASTSQPSDDGSDSPDPHPTPPSPAPTDDQGSLLDLLSGSWD